MSSTRRVVKIARDIIKRFMCYVTTKRLIFLQCIKKNVTFETTPQHLTLYAPDCYDKLGTYAQMDSPLRTKKITTIGFGIAIKNDIVDVLGSDHAPHTKENKKKVYPDLHQNARSSNYFSNNVRSCEQRQT